MFDFSSISKASKSSDSLIKRNPDTFNNDYINLLGNHDKIEENTKNLPFPPGSKKTTNNNEIKNVLDIERNDDHKSTVNSKYVSKSKIIDDIYVNHSLNDMGIPSSHIYKYVQNQIFNKPSPLKNSDDSEIMFKYTNKNYKPPLDYLPELSNFSSGMDKKPICSHIIKPIAQNTESNLISRHNSEYDIDKKSEKSEESDVSDKTEKTLNSQNSHRPLNLIKYSDSNIKNSHNSINKFYSNSLVASIVSPSDQLNMESSPGHKSESKIEHQVSEEGEPTRRKIHNAPKKQNIIQNMKHRGIVKEKRINFFLTKDKDKKKSLADLNPSVFQQFVIDSEKNTVFGRNTKYLKWLDLVLCCLVIANISLSIIDNEIYLSETNKYIEDLILKESTVAHEKKMAYDAMGLRELTIQENFLRFINCIIVVCILISIFLHYFFKIKILRADHKLSEHEGMWKSGFLKYMLMEMFICSIVYPPYMNNVIYGEMLGQSYAYGINALICIIVTLKSYVFFRIYSYFSSWTTEAANSICHKYNVVPGIHFAMKAELKKRPYTALFFSSIFIVVILSFAVRTFEYYVVAEITNKSTGENLQLLSDSIWMILVTMTTVGFGEYFPRSHFGRFIGVVSCVIGMLLVSLIVVSLAIISEFTSEEKKAYSFLKKINAENNMTDKATIVIQKLIKLQYMQKVKKSKLSERFILVTQLKQSISIFKSDSKIANSYDLPFDHQIKLLENKLKKDINTLDTNIKRISNVDEIFNLISKDQKNCISMMEVINERQVKLTKYMVELNNKIFKRNIEQFHLKQELKKSIKSNKSQNKLKLNSQKIKVSSETKSRSPSRYSKINTIETIKREYDDSMGLSPFYLKRTNINQNKSKSSFSLETNG